MILKPDKGQRIGIVDKKDYTTFSNNYLIIQQIWNP